MFFSEHSVFFERYVRTLTYSILAYVYRRAMRRVHTSKYDTRLLVHGEDKCNVGLFHVIRLICTDIITY